MTSLLAGNPKSAPVLLKQGLHPKEKGKSDSNKERDKKKDRNKEREKKQTARQKDRKGQRDRNK